jgi:hypothetical protein
MKSFITANSPTNHQIMLNRVTLIDQSLYKSQGLYICTLEASSLYRAPINPAYLDMDTFYHFITSNPETRQEQLHIHKMR